ncbi:MAG: lipocalin family protein [Alistipes sp.]|nr:lipocalin family protein [Alistipes sp.]
MTALCCKAQSTVNTATIASLDVERYMGRWYELARYDHSFERDLEYCQAQYTQLPDGKIRVENRGVNSKNGKHKSSIGKAKMGDTPGQLRVSFFLFFYSDYNILALDNNYEWALVGSKSPKYLWILSRTPKLPQTVMDDILSIAQQRGYDTSKLIFVKH